MSVYTQIITLHVSDILLAQKHKFLRKKEQQ